MKIFNITKSSEEQSCEQSGPVLFYDNLMVLGRDILFKSILAFVADK